VVVTRHGGSCCAGGEHFGLVVPVAAGALGGHLRGSCLNSFVAVHVMASAELSLA
jgi:hypothetical protein